MKGKQIMKVTFLVGNGFDLNQNLKTSYADFYKVYAKPNKRDSKAVADFKKHIEQSGLWSDLEVCLGYILREYKESELDSYYEGLEDLKKQLSVYLANQEKRFKYKISRIKREFVRAFYSYYLDSGYGHPFRDLYQDHSTSNEFSFIVFNYTGIINKMKDKLKRKNLSLNYKGVKNEIKDVLLIHGTAKKGFILGINDEGQINNENLKNVDSLQHYIIKSLQIDTMNQGYSRNDKKASDIISGSDIIYVYGMSIGSTDKKYWELVNKWLSEESEHTLIVSHFDDKFSTISMGRIEEENEKIRQKLHSFGFSDNTISTQVKVVTNSTLFSFKKRYRKYN